METRIIILPPFVEAAAVTAAAPLSRRRFRTLRRHRADRSSPGPM